MNISVKHELTRELCTYLLWRYFSGNPHESTISVAKFYKFSKALLECEGKTGFQKGDLALQEALNNYTGDKRGLLGRVKSATDSIMEVYGD